MIDREGGKDAASAKGITFIRDDNGYVVYEVGSGKYRFVNSYEVAQ